MVLGDIDGTLRIVTDAAVRQDMEVRNFHDFIVTVMLLSHRASSEVHRSRIKIVLL